MAGRGGAFGRLYRGETTFDFAGRWRRWLAISGTIILIGLISLAVRGLNFSIDFKGGTTWEVATTASVAQVRDTVGSVDPTLRQATIQVLTNRLTGRRSVEVEATAKTTTDAGVVNRVTGALADMAHVPREQVQINAIGPSWGSDVTNAAIKAVIIFLIAVSAYIWLRFEGKMALAALIALVHDILITLGIYSLSGLQVSPDTVIAFLTILGYSLYDTIVVFDKVQENTRSLASTNRMTYTETVNLSMNQVLARSLNTSFVAIIPILAILVIGAGVLGAGALSDFGFALFIGLTTGAYSSIFIASPLLAVFKEREPRYAEIRRRLGSAPARRLTPRQAAAVAGAAAGAGRSERAEPARSRPPAPRPVKRTASVSAPGATPARGDTTVDGTATEDGAPAAGNGAPASGNGGAPVGDGARAGNGATSTGNGAPLVPRTPPPPRPRKKKRH